MPPVFDYNVGIERYEIEYQRFENEIRDYIANHSDPTVPSCLFPQEREQLDVLMRNLNNFASDLGELPSLGMIGNMSSAKTSCVELLLGAVGKLGACQQMGTTNAIEYRVRCDENALQTTFENYRCEFLSEAELKNLLPDFQNAVSMQAPTVLGNVDYDLIRKFAFDQNKADGSENPNYIDRIFQQQQLNWGELRRWTLEMIRIVPSDNLPNLSKALRELHWLVRSVHFGREWFGKRFRISESQARCLSVSDGKRGVLHFQDLQQEYANPLPSPPSCEPDEYGFFNMPTETICNELRYLVKIIRVDVKAPVTTTARFTIDGGLRLVDVPGLGSAASNIRDKAIMKEILPGLNGVLYMLDTGNPVYLQEGVRLLQDCQALDRTVVVCSKFDQISLPKTEVTEKVGWHPEKQPYNVLNWGSFDELLDAFEASWGRGNFSRMVPFSLFYFLAREAQEFDPATKEQNCDYADDAFLNNDTGDYCKSRFCRDAIRRYFPTIIQKLEESQTNGEVGATAQERLQVVEMLKGFERDGGASRLVSAYEVLLRGAAVTNRLSQLRMSWNALVYDFQKVQGWVEARGQNGIGVGNNVGFNALSLLKEWSDDSLWERLKLNVKKCLDNNKNLEKPVFLAHLFLLPLWSELNESRSIYGGRYDYELQTNGLPAGVNTAPLVNEPGRDIPQDTGELFEQIDEYYQVFVNGICARLCAEGNNNPKVKTLGAVFDDVIRDFNVNDGQLDELIAFSTLMTQQGGPFIDDFGIVQNNWAQFGNFYEVLSRNFVQRGRDTINELKNDPEKGWNLPGWRLDKYPLQTSRDPNDGSKPLVFPWNIAFRNELAVALAHNPTLKSEKLSLERVRELRYQLQKACDYLVEETYSKLELSLYSLLDTMKYNLTRQIAQWRRFGGQNPAPQGSRGGFTPRPRRPVHI